MGWIGCIHCEKFGHDFVARTFALIEPVQPILHRVSYSNEMVLNAPKYYETHQNMSLGPDGVDRVDLLLKILTQLCGLNFCINFNSSACFELSIVKQRNGPKCTQTLRNKTKQNISLVSNGVDRVHSFRKIRTRLHGTNFCINCPVQPVLHRVSCSNEKVPKAPKRYKMQQKTSLCSNGLQWCN